MKFKGFEDMNLGSGESGEEKDAAAIESPAPLATAPEANKTVLDRRPPKVAKKAAEIGPSVVPTGVEATNKSIKDATPLSEVNARKWEEIEREQKIWREAEEKERRERIEQAHKREEMRRVEALEQEHKREEEERVKNMPKKESRTLRDIMFAKKDTSDLGTSMKKESRTLRDLMFAKEGESGKDTAALDASSKSEVKKPTTLRDLMFGKKE